MSDLERPWAERRRSGPPSSCPVCGAATMEVVIAGVITCRSAGLDHFEWRPDVPPVVSVSSERVDQATFVRLAAGPCSACADGCTRPGAAAPCCPHPGCDPNRTDDESVPPCPVHDADNRRYDNSLTIPHSPPEVEGWSHLLHIPGCPALNRSGDCTCPPVPPGTKLPRPDDVVTIEGELMGRDFVETAERRLSRDAAELASLHRPVFGRPPYCWACTTGGRGHERRVDSGRRAPWPCTTASLALDMMNLTASDIAITDE